MSIKRVARVLGGKLNTSSNPYQLNTSTSLIEPLAETKAKQAAASGSVQLSEAAKLRSKRKRPNSNEDIDEADLPESIKVQLNTQRDFRRKIIQRISELQDIMDNKSLHPSLRKQRSQMLQTEIMALETEYVQQLKQIEDRVKALHLSVEQTDLVTLLLTL